MKVLLISTTEKTGGAAIAVNRIHHGLKDLGVDSKLLVSYKTTNSDSVIQHPKGISYFNTGTKYVLDKLYTIKYNLDTQWSTNLVNYSFKKRIKKINPDLVQLNWVGAGYFPIQQISNIDKPIVWRLSDMWPFTGGCHYSEGCDKYEKKCGRCPILKSNEEYDLSRKIWLKKNKHYTKKIVVVAISNWLKKKAEKSSLFKNNKIVVIHNGVDTNIFYKKNKKESRKLFELPQNKKIILFGAQNSVNDKRKGYEYILNALEHVKTKNVELVVFGSKEKAVKKIKGIKAHYVGRINDWNKMSSLYSCADVMLVPSLEEAFGQTALESMACGTPVVCFKDTGVEDMIEHKKNGYSAKFKDSKDLAKGIDFVLNTPKLSKNALNKVKKEFTINIIANKYKELYESLIK